MLKLMQICRHHMCRYHGVGIRGYSVQGRNSRVHRRHHRCALPGHKGVQKGVLAAVLCVMLAASSCASDTEEKESTSPSPAAGESKDPQLVDPQLVLATTGIWADVVKNIACDDMGEVQVEAIIPVGGDAHGFEPSLADRERMESADLLVANGLWLEEGLEDTIEAVEGSGVPVFRIGEHINTIEFVFEEAHDDHDEEGGS